MKEDHMGNGQLEPAYNLQFSTSKQYITTYSIHQNTTDTNTLTSHTEQHINLYNEAPESITADAGDGSKQNYQYLENKEIEAFVKHNQFDRLQHKTTQQKHPFTADKLHHNAAGDYYVCPMGQHMNYMGAYSKITAAGYKQEVKKYRTGNCGGCPLRGVCHQSKGNRMIEINANLNRLKAKVEELQKRKGY